MKKDMRQGDICKPFTTQYKIRFTYQSHCVSKNVTPRMMLEKLSKIFQMNCEIDCFTNMYDMQGCISCGILVSGIRARGVSSEHMENMEMFSFSPT